MPVIPVLSLADPEAGGRMLAGVFGFAGGVTGGDMVLGDQRVRLTRGAPGRPGGVIDHVALAVPDLDAAAAAMRARGARLAAEVTPEGAREIAEFWTAGVRYLFLEGPEGARIELCQNLGAPKGPGQDHLGLPTADIGALAGFLAGLGAVEIARNRLIRAEGVTEVRFLALAGSVLELYQPPVAPATAPGPWRRLLVPGLTAEVEGPGGLILAPA